MVQEYFNALPPVDRLHVDLTGCIVSVVFSENHLKHFQHIDTKSKRFDKICPVSYIIIQVQSLPFLDIDNEGDLS